MQNDPLQICRRPGDGRVQLCGDFNVWIDSGHLTFLQRWLDTPKELTRCLLKKLVGPGHLVHMCARGRSKDTECISEDIMSAVEYK